MKRFTSADFNRMLAEGQGRSSVADSGAGSSGDRLRLIEENYKLRDQLKRQEGKETRERSRSPNRKVKRESTDEEEERIIRENKRARSTKPERRTPKGSVGVFLKEKAARSEETPTASEGVPQKASDGTSPKKPDKRRPREPAYPPGVKAMESPEEREANKREREESEKKEKKPKVKAMPSKVKAKPKAPDSKSDAKPANSGFTSGALGMLRSALASNLSSEIETEEDPDKKAELEKQKKELQRDTPRQSIKITEDNMRDQSFHDSRYYADVAAGKPHHIAWKNEKGRRRTILDRRSGLVDRASEKLELDDKWHSKHNAPGTGKKRKDLDGLNADVDTEVVEDRKDKSKPIERRDEAVPLSRKERESFQQFPDDEKAVLERPATRKAAEPRIRGKDYYKRKREARKERKRQAKHEAERTRQRRHSWDDQYNNWQEDEEEEAPEVHDSGSEPNETDEERSDSELNSFSAPPNASFGEPHVVEERSYKTASAESLADEGGVVLRGTDANGSSKILEGRVTGVHRTLASGAKVAKHRHIALGARGGLLIPKDSKVGKEYSAFTDKLYKKHEGMTPVAPTLLAGLPIGSKSGNSNHWRMLQPRRPGHPMRNREKRLERSKRR
ncbi:Retrovirus-related Pol polyprotein from transposon TNT 1-94 [Durusdinium trenchii]|uniref:Retrovirus-related Pol polyprotein from transposon TNT 1-94 n=1 Tax=Durusdinium trenchii TaxID=1381693 RepID=A0ABP0HPY2_9DINO